jgi:hypothetical protein
MATDQQHPKIRVFRILYNDSCNDYSFDDEFFSDLFTRTYQEKFGGSLIETEEKLNKYYDRRQDPRVLEIYDLLGEKSNKRDEGVYSSLKITYFPIELKDYLQVIVQDGGECMSVDQLKIYKEFYERVIKNDESVDNMKPLQVENVPFSIFQGSDTTEELKQRTPKASQFEFFRCIKPRYQRLEYIIDQYHKEMMKRKPNFNDENIFEKEDLI